MLKDFIHIDEKKTINEIDNLFKILFPICRSITGNGVKESLSILKNIVDFDIKQIPSGTKCYDWTIPDEWNIKDAYIKDSHENKLIDFKENNLHVVNYSVPINQKLSFNELDKHLYTLPSMPDAIPYVTSYYEKDWGFCIPYNQYKNLDKNADYHVVIDSTLQSGNLTYGESIIKGRSEQEILFSTYCCHPSLGNDNLSGMVLWTLILRELKTRQTNYTYRFVIAPETIGSIAYIAKNQEQIRNILGGFIFTCVAGPGKFYYKKTFYGDHMLDKIAITVLNESKNDYETRPFDITGSDERQYSSQFFRIPIGTICKDKYGEYDYYHTSKDNLDFISSENLFRTMKLYLELIDKIENTSLRDLEFENSESKIPTINKGEHLYCSLNPWCEPMLSKRDVYPTKSGRFRTDATNIKKNESKEDNTSVYETQIINLNHMLWVLFYSDGYHSIEHVSRITGIQINSLLFAAERLKKVGLLEEIKNVGK